MGDGSGLGDISKELEQAQQASNDDESEQSSEEQNGVETDVTVSTGTSARTDTDESSADPREDPAFDYDDTVQFPIYAREAEARDEFESARQYEAQRLLDTEYGLKNIEKREMHDAALRLVADNPELWASYVMEARGLDVPDDLDGE